MRLSVAIAAVLTLGISATSAVSQTVLHSDHSYIDPRAQHTVAGWVAGAVYELTLRSTVSYEQKCDVTWTFFDGRVGQWRTNTTRLTVFPGSSETSTLRGARAGTAEWRYLCN